MTERERDLKPRWRLVHDLNVEALEAQVAALDAALQRANSRIAHYCAACEGAERSRDTYCTDCALVATQADVDARTPDAARDWLADRRTVAKALAFLEPLAQILSTYKTDAGKASNRILFVLGGDETDAAITVGDIMRGAAALARARARGWLEA